VEKTKYILDHPKVCREMVELNYALGLKFFSYAVLDRLLRSFMAEWGWRSPSDSTPQK